MFQVWETFFTHGPMEANMYKRIINKGNFDEDVWGDTDVDLI